MSGKELSTRSFSRSGSRSPSFKSRSKSRSRNGSWSGSRSRSYSRSHSRSRNRSKGSRSRSRGKGRSRSRSRSSSRSRSRSRSRTRKYRSRSRSFPRDRKFRGSDIQEAQNDGKTLYIANLGYRCVEEDLEERFTVFGSIESLELMKDPVTRESRGFAFITYKDSLDANDAQRKMDGTQLNGRSIRVEFSKRKKGHPKTPGFYAGPVSASRKYGTAGGFGGYGGGRGRSRDRDYDYDDYDRRR